MRPSSSTVILQSGAVQDYPNNSFHAPPLLFALQHRRRLLSQHRAEMTAHVVLLVGLVGVEHADNGAIGVVAEFQHVVDELLRLRLVVERGHELHDTIDEHHVGLLVGDGLAQ